jgi:hypothetical protein
MAQELEYSTFADWEKVKGSFTNLYFICAANMTDYYLKPNPRTEMVAKESLMKLMLPMYPKLYILKDPKAVNYIAFFQMNPHMFTLMDTHTVWLILQRAIERLGITKIEQAQAPKHRAFMEDED